ncbi:hypothetical protein IEQ34_016499 [Dendrobium chrysotoxum]|uniref:Uncharacterized protein n=1 Tax=Dendrobium chrysotoxum TaxID=161865 RepID=A0AAV7FXV2_DENCH|nr:hypothetical protein IEQ34_016499 [Dendrobium chrysotoxum]
MENRFENLEDMMKKMIEMKSKALAVIHRAESKRTKIMEKIMRKLMEMQSKTPPMVPIANPNQDLIGIPLDKFKGKEIGREEFDEKSSFHQKLPPRTPKRGEIGFSDEGTAIREFYCGGGVINHYERFFGQIREGRVEPWGSGHVRWMKEKWEFHPQYTEETWRDHDNHYTRGGGSYWGNNDPRVRKLKMRKIEEMKSESSISDKQAPSEDKLIKKDVNEQGKEINLQSQGDVADQNLSLVQSDPAKTSTSQEPIFSKSKNEDLKDIETKSTSKNERKIVKVSLVSTDVGISEDGNVEIETQNVVNIEFSKDKVIRRFHTNRL